MTDVMIADDNVVITKQLSGMLTNEKNIRVINISYNGLDAIMSYNYWHPTVLILNLDLPGINGVNVLKELNDKKKNVIILTGSMELYTKIRDIDKVRWFIPNPYNYTEILDVIEEINIEENLLTTNIIEKEIDNVFKILNFNKYLKGTILLKKAIKIAYNNPTMRFKEIITRVIFEQGIGNALTIHSNIDKCIHSVYSRQNNKEIFYNLFPEFCGDNLTASKFIEYMTNYLKKIY